MQIKNPFVRKSRRLNILDEAFKIVHNELSTHAHAFDLTTEELLQLQYDLKKVYMEKKIEYTIDHNVSLMNNYFEAAAQNALNANPNDSSSMSSFYYVKRTRQLVTNEY